jgi:serine phosphatase RsbU (regulator of sigma subunit)
MDVPIRGEGFLMPAALSISVRSGSPAEETRIAGELRRLLAELRHIEVVELSRSSGPGKIVMVDGACPDLKRWLDDFCRSEARKGVSLWLWVDDKAPLPQVFVSGQVDDLLIHPIRPLELLSKLRNYEQQRIVHDVLELQSSLEGVMTNLKGDLEVLERLQKARLPVRFPDVKGFNITSRYLAGEKSGGDYFDLAESQDGQQLGILVTDSSSYGLSSAVLSAVVRVVSRVSVEQSRSVREMVRSFYEELLTPLGPQDRLSIFYGTLSRKDYILRYLTLGSVRAFYRPPQGSFEELPAQGGPLSQGSRNSLSSAALAEGSLAWVPGGRVVILSDGVLESLGGSGAALEMLERFKARDAKDLLNELAFGIKSRLSDPKEDLPPQDCTGMVMDLDPKVIRRIS